MKKLAFKSYIFIFSAFQLFFCSRPPDDEAGFAIRVLDSAKLEGVDVKSPKDYYYLHDTIYKVLEEIERKKMRIFSGDYEKQVRQLRMLVYQLDSVRRLNRLEEEVSIGIE